MRIRARLTMETEVELRGIAMAPFESPKDVMEQLVGEGLKQYIKDYDPDLGYEIPEVTILEVDKRAHS